jgi:glycosyltransferase involved in cell wall biosynthesis
VIIGRGILEKKLKNYILQNKLRNLVKLLKFRENPYPYIAQSDIFVLSSSYEGLPNVLLESLVLNKFIISSNCRTGPKEILLEGKGGDLFKVGDYKKLAKLIVDYKKNKNTKLKKLMFARKNLNRFNYKINLNKYLNLVNSVI